MSLIKLLPAWLHAIADYAVGAVLVVVALTVDMTTEATLAGVVIGATVLAVSVLTKYPLGVVKVLSFRLHSAGDYAATALLFASPFALGFNNTDSGITALYIGVGVAVLGVSLITNYQYADRDAPVTELAATVTAPVAVPTARSTPKATAATRKATMPRAAATTAKPAARTTSARRATPLRAQGR